MSKVHHKNNQGKQNEFVIDYIMHKVHLIEFFEKYEIEKLTTGIQPQR